MRSLRALLCALTLLLAAAPAALAQQLTVYSSLPLTGASKAQTRDVVRGARLALQRANGQAGGRPVRYVSLDDATRRAGTWMPEREAANARRAREDASAIAYIGAFNSGASAISMPILNEGGILQVSPSNTYIGLTAGGPGAERGEPDKYQPVGTRTYGRVVPNDRVQGRAGAALLQQLGAKRVLVVHDGEIYGRGVAQIAADSLRARGIRVTGFRRLARRGRNARSLARLARGADAMYYGGITDNGARQLWRAVARRSRLIKVGSDGIAECGFTDTSCGGVTSRVTRNTYLTVQTLAPSALPPAGQEVVRALGGNPDPYAIYGYEAMALVLDSINRGGPTREGAVKAFFATKDRDSVLGRYSITPDGDTTLTQYGVYTVDDGELVFDRAVDAGP